MKEYQCRCTGKSSDAKKREIENDFFDCFTYKFFKYCILLSNKNKLRVVICSTKQMSKWVTGEHVSQENKRSREH